MFRDSRISFAVSSALHLRPGEAESGGLLEVEQENLRKQIGAVQPGSGFARRAVRAAHAQVRQLENEQRDLRARTAANLRAGNRDAAAQ